MSWSFTMRHVALASAILLATTVYALPPQDADPALAPWFQSLQQPGTSYSCCSLADCRMTESRIKNGNYEALIGDKWVAVPPNRILQRTDNPTGRAVVCWMAEFGIVCFVRAPET